MCVSLKNLDKSLLNENVGFLVWMSSYVVNGLSLFVKLDAELSHKDINKLLSLSKTKSALNLNEHRNILENLGIHSIMMVFSLIKLVWIECDVHANCLATNLKLNKLISTSVVAIKLPADS